MPAAFGNHDTVAIAHEYFRRLDGGDGAILDLFTEDVEIYFPKYGIGKGHAAFIEIATQLGRVVASTEHPVSDYLFIGSGNCLAVEGTTSGVLKDGRKWAAGETPAGRFCNIFEFRKGLISRLHVYLDPDYAGKDEDSFLWGHEGRQW